MSEEIEAKLRGPGAYALARHALAAMEAHAAWPTPVNFELWTYFVGAPDSPLGREIARLLSTGEAFTDLVADELAAAYLPKAKLSEQIRDAGDALTKELDAVSLAIKTAQKSSEAYGDTLAGASRTLTGPAGFDLKAMVDTLISATRQVQQENKLLESRLSESTSQVVKLREHLEQVRREATTDGLTNLANRKAFDEELARACADAVSDGQNLTLALIDIDHFKTFNDTWGHQTGDQVIRYVASVIGRVGAPPRFAARYGGEEFALIFPRERVEQAAAVLEDIREEVGSRMLKRRSTNDDLGAITISAGLAELRGGEGAHGLMERADKALYVSKRSGRNRVSTAEHSVAA
ncbi:MULTISPECIES: GGDEF domain-containing protein [Phenylobacterium]|uniref:diguanylate cyclase n=1 Tax=Phenylobacterium koreense TaxID=266125 RepID=A0ABV2EKR2_9CAUL